MKKRILSLILVLVMAIGFIPTIVFAATPTSGTCGDNLTWTFDSSTGTLTIDGTGEMYNYFFIDNAISDLSPWYTYKNAISNIKINSGVTSIGSYAFCDTNVITVTVPDNIISIGIGAFYRCRNLVSAKIPNHIQTINEDTFGGCYSLVEFTIPNGISSIGYNAFGACSSLTTITIPISVSSIFSWAFDDCDSLKTIIYGGTKQDKNKISIDTYNDPLLNATWIYHEHKYDNACDTTCDCGYTRTVAGHKYDNACDKDCNYCGATRNTEHKYDNACDTNCNVCGATRTTTHSFGAYVSDNNATTEKDGTKTRTCSVCGHKETVTDVGSKLPAPDPDEIQDTSKIFTDIPENAWFKTYVDYAYSNGIFSGTSATTFSPNTKITRAQFVQVLANLEGVDLSTYKSHDNFTDVKTNQWFSGAVNWAFENGIVSGSGNGQFSPNVNVSREQMCVMLLNYASYKGVDFNAVNEKVNFTDDAKISSWAKIAVYTCQKAGIVSGKGEGKFDPQGLGTRAEASVIFTKFHKEYLVK